MPTCGPLPWDTTTLMPSATMSTMCSAVFFTSSSCSCGRVAQGVAAQRDDHALALAFPVCHGFTPFRMHGPKTSQDAGMRDVFRMVERLCRPERPAHPSGQSRVHDGLDGVHAVLGLVEHLGLLATRTPRRSTSISVTPNFLAMSAPMVVRVSWKEGRQCMKIASGAAMAMTFSFTW